MDAGEKKSSLPKSAGNKLDGSLISCENLFIRRRNKYERGTREIGEDEG